MPGRLLIVDDDPAVRASLADAVRDLGLEPTTANDREGAMQAVARSHPDIVLSDVRLPDGSGLDLLAFLRDRMPGLPVILMTAFDDMPTVVTAIRDGAVDFLVKPLDLDELGAVLDRTLGDRRLGEPTPGVPSADGGSEGADLDALVGRDPRMIRIFKRIGRLAATRLTVLIRGETGTGKERVARALHAHAPWADEPFVAVNCTALPQALLESELFGHVKGAFTGAHAARGGRVAAAGSGTLFLDEIGDTTPEFQARLLRLLETGDYTPLGSDATRTIAARVITATRRNLEEAVAEGRFREDLYYRLRVAEIELPPLRDRTGDIPELAEHLIRKAAARAGRAAPRLLPETLARLGAHRWPGNVRELENCLTRAVALLPGTVLRPDDLRLGEGTRSGPGAAARGFGEAGNVFRPLAEVEGEHVARVLAAVDGNKTRAAEVLGISRPTLYRLLDSHGLS